MKNPSKKNYLNWSYSSEKLWDTCPRKLWFKIWAEWFPYPDDFERECFILSQINTIEMWRGTFVHNMIDQVIIPRLKEGLIPSEESIQAMALERAKRQFEFSRQRKYRDPRISKTKAGDAYAAIWEDEFDTVASKLTPNEALAEIELCLSNFFKQSDLLDKLSHASWLESEIPLVHKDKKNEETMNGKIDILAITNSPSPELYLIDWKVDKKQATDYAPQLYHYAFLIDHEQITSYSLDWGHNYRNLPTGIKELPKRLLEVNLLNNVVTEHEWTDEHKIEAEDLAFQGILRLRKLLDGRNPKEISGDELDVTENPNTCKFCPYRKLCQAI